MEKIKTYKSVILSLIAFCFITGCTQNKEKSSFDIMSDENRFGILNYGLRDSINSYISDVEYSSNEKEYLVGVNYENMGDTVCFEISYLINLFSYCENPPLYLTSIGDVKVVFQTKLLNFVSIDKERIHNIYRKSFPKQYSYYLRIGEMPPPNSYRHEHWRLVFIKDKCVKKEKFK